MSERSIRRARQRRIEREEKREQRLSTRKKVAIAAGAGLGATVLFAPGAQAATFTVTKLADTDDAVCDADCSLREAADAANLAADADTITFASGLSGTISLVNGQIPLYAATDVQGPGADVLRISGRGDSRIFYVNAATVGASGDPVSISGLRLVQGYDSSDGGALYSDETALTLNNLVFANNHSGGAGGALHTDDGNVAVNNTVFSQNSASNWGGAFYLEDTSGTAANDVEAIVSNSVFTDNTSGNSGGGLDIDDPDGTTIVENSTFADNSALDEGGGITVNNMDGNADLIIRGVTLSGNTAAFGGGLYTEDVTGNTLIQNTTITRNTSFYDGGGINFGYLYNDQVTEIRNSTITNNTAALDPGANGSYSGGGVFLSDTANADNNGPVTISSTIVSGNTADTGPDLGQEPLADGFNVGFSLLGNATGATINTTPADSNIVGADPQLGGLANNGGPTPTLLPSLTSPVLDAGVAGGASVDQRGLARTAELTSAPNRPGSDGTDIGAVEIQSAECQGSFVPSKTGTNNGETITGTDGPDALLALGGDDSASGLKANDCVDGGDGKDSLSGDEGKDLVTGGGGDDKIDGGKGKDKAKGNDGKDTVIGGPGKDKMKGNGGKDLMKAVDDTKDKVNCGGGKDKAKVDAIDKVNKNCEVIKVANK